MNKVVATSTVSSKYQIVIPKKLRRQYGITAGQRLQLVAKKDGVIAIQTASNVRQLAGKYDGIWGKDASSYVKEMHEEWEEHQEKIDALRS